MSALLPTEDALKAVFHINEYKKLPKKHKDYIHALMNYWILAGAKNNYKWDDTLAIIENAVLSKYGLTPLMAKLQAEIELKKKKRRGELELTTGETAPKTWSSLSMEEKGAVGIEVGDMVGEGFTEHFVLEHLVTTQGLVLEPLLLEWVHGLIQESEEAEKEVESVPKSFDELGAQEQSKLAEWVSKEHYKMPEGYKADALILAAVAEFGIYQDKELSNFIKGIMIAKGEKPTWSLADYEDGVLKEKIRTYINNLAKNGATQKEILEAALKHWPLEEDEALLVAIAMALTEAEDMGAAPTPEDLLNAPWDYAEYWGKENIVKQIHPHIPQAVSECWNEVLSKATGMTLSHFTVAPILLPMAVDDYGLGKETLKQLWKECVDAYKAGLLEEAEAVVLKKVPLGAEDVVSWDDLPNEQKYEFAKAVKEDDISTWPELAQMAIDWDIEADEDDLPSISELVEMADKPPDYGLTFEQVNKAALDILSVATIDLTPEEAIKKLGTWEFKTLADQVKQQLGTDQYDEVIGQISEKALQEALSAWVDLQKADQQAPVSDIAAAIELIKNGKPYAGCGPIKNIPEFNKPLAHYCEGLMTQPGKKMSGFVDYPDDEVATLLAVAKTTPIIMHYGDGYNTKVAAEGGTLELLYTEGAKQGEHWKERMDAVAEVLVEKEANTCTFQDSSVVCRSNVNVHSSIGVGSIKRTALFLSSLHAVDSLPRDCVRPAVIYAHEGATSMNNDLINPWKEAPYPYSKSDWEHEVCSKLEKPPVSEEPEGIPVFKGDLAGCEVKADVLITPPMVKYCEGVMRFPNKPKTGTVDFPTEATHHYLHNIGVPVGKDEPIVAHEPDNYYAYVRSPNNNVFDVVFRDPKSPNSTHANKRQKEVEQILGDHLDFNCTGGTAGLVCQKEVNDPMTATDNRDVRRTAAFLSALNDIDKLDHGCITTAVKFAWNEAKVVEKADGNLHKTLPYPIDLDDWKKKVCQS